MSGFLRCGGKDLEFGIEGQRKLSDLPASFGLLLDSAVDDAFIHTVTGAALRADEDQKLSAHRTIRYREGSKLVVKRVRIRGRDVISAEVANDRYRKLGLEFEHEISEGLAEVKAERKRQAIFREAVFARPGSDAALVTTFLMAEAAATIEPANLALTIWALPLRIALPILRHSPRFGSFIAGGAIAARDFALTVLPIELQAHADDEGRDLRELTLDFFTGIGLGGVVESVGGLLGFSRRTDGVSDGSDAGGGVDPGTSSTNRSQMAPDEGDPSATARTPDSAASSLTDSLKRLPPNDVLVLYQEVTKLMKKGVMPDNPRMVEFLKALDELAGRIPRSTGDANVRSRALEERPPSDEAIPRPATVEERLASGVTGNALSGTVSGVLYEPEDMTVDAQDAQDFERSVRRLLGLELRPENVP